MFMSGTRIPPSNPQFHQSYNSFSSSSSSYYHPHYPPSPSTPPSYGAFGSMLASIGSHPYLLLGITVIAGGVYVCNRGLKNTWQDMKEAVAGGWEKLKAIVARDPPGEDFGIWADAYTV